MKKVASPKSSPKKYEPVKGRPAHNECTNEALSRAVEMMGGTCALARLMDIVPSSVSHWVRGRHLMTPQRAIQIEEITKGKVKREELRPDIFIASKRK